MMQAMLANVNVLVLEGFYADDSKVVAVRYLDGPRKGQRRTVSRRAVRWVVVEECECDDDSWCVEHAPKQV
jgi:hypothetical protein